ncbi:Retinoblastoma-binding protein 5 -like protein [Halotydeus destructor]|nr:Retinoblastoma-binding protein 5 -like protein [Halotydeus destructor]
MNIELLEQFGQSYPEEFDGALDSISLAVTCAFNRRGTLLAVGCNDGRIVIWDFLTRGIAKIITAHVHPVCSLSWSRRGHQLASASTDNIVCVWDVLSSDPVAKWRFGTPIMKVQFNPRDEKMLLICPLKHAALTVTVGAEGKESKPKILPLDEDSDLNITAAFDSRGQYVFTGNARGRVVVIKLGAQLEIVASFRVGNTAIKQIEFPPKKKDCFLVNTADRVIRVYDVKEVLTCGTNGEPEPVQKLQDLVNKTMWKKCCFSGGPDADYICAGSSRQHSLYIWERSGGTLVKILHGTKGELLLDVVWHPLRPIIASISSGVVSIWAQAQVENWSAFAPDFKELDENVEYEERESEFDVEDEDRSPARVAQDKDNEDIDVDVTTDHPTALYLSSDEDEEDERHALVYLPVTLEIDEPEQMDGPANDEPQERPTKVKAHDVHLPDASTDEIHPMLAGVKPRNATEKVANKPGRPATKRQISSTSDVAPKRKKKPGYAYEYD